MSNSYFVKSVTTRPSIITRTIITTTKPVTITTRPSIITRTIVTTTRPQVKPTSQIPQHSLQPIQTKYGAAPVQQPIQTKYGAAPVQQPIQTKYGAAPVTPTPVAPIWAIQTKYGVIPTSQYNLDKIYSQIKGLDVTSVINDVKDLSSSAKSAVSKILSSELTTISGLTVSAAASSFDSVNTILNKYDDFINSTLAPKINKVSELQGVLEKRNSLLKSSNKVSLDELNEVNQNAVRILNEICNVSIAVQPIQTKYGVAPVLPIQTKYGPAPVTPTPVSPTITIQTKYGVSPACQSGVTQGTNTYVKTYQSMITKNIDKKY